MIPLLKRRCDRRNVVTLADRGGEHVGDEEADGLRLLILVAACGPFASRASAPRHWGTRELGNAMPLAAVLFTEERE